ncbi:MAG TPA: hypothetical protein VMV83_00770 [Rectinemataceae bacterium]|nr:hypothetical protein [Rectinemataceae bacterium]
MGIFDTLVLDPPLVCPRCGAVHASLQTKLLDSSLSTYRPGMIVPGCPVHMGVLKENIWCCPREEGSDNQSLDVWIVIWHGIYAGSFLDAETAERRLNGVDRLDLLSWLDMMQKSSAGWRKRFHGLSADLRDMLEWRADENAKEAKGKGGKRRSFDFHRLPEEIRKDPDPLRRILERNEPDKEDDIDSWDWW